MGTGTPRRAVRPLGERLPGHAGGSYRAKEIRSLLLQVHNRPSTATAISWLSPVLNRYHRRKVLKAFMFVH